MNQWRRFTQRYMNQGRSLSRLPLETPAEHTLFVSALDTVCTALEVSDTNKARLHSEHDTYRRDRLASWSGPSPRHNYDYNRALNRGRFLLAVGLRPCWVLSSCRLFWPFLPGDVLQRYIVSNTSTTYFSTTVSSMIEQCSAQLA